MFKPETHHIWLVSLHYSRNKWSKKQKMNTIFLLLMFLFTAHLYMYNFFHHHAMIEINKSEKATNKKEKKQLMTHAKQVIHIYRKYCHMHDI